MKRTLSRKCDSVEDLNRTEEQDGAALTTKAGCLYHSSGTLPVSLLCIGGFMCHP